VTVVSHRGNEITKHGDENNPAVHIERPGNDVAKKASELNVDKKAGESSSNGTSEEKKEESNKEESTKDEAKTEEKNDDHKSEESKKDESKTEESKAEKKDEADKPSAGDKRKADEKADADGAKESKVEEDTGAKKHKTINGTAAAPATNGETEKKKPGRPKGTNAAKKEKKAPAVGRAERKTRSQGSV
jgi:hypothetical protein